jgi:hypothetical protein
MLWNIHNPYGLHTQFMQPINYIYTNTWDAHVHTSVIAHNTLFICFWNKYISLTHTLLFLCFHVNLHNRHKYISFASLCACCSVLCGYHFDSIHWALMCTQQRNFTLSMCFWNKCQINQLSRFISAGWIYYCIIYSLSFATYILWVDRWLSENWILYF